MAARTHLKVVPEGAKPVRQPRAKTITQAAASGDARELLVAMRTRIAKAVQDPDTPARDLAALTKRLMEVVREIEGLDARAEESGGFQDPGDGQFDASAV